MNESEHRTPVVEKLSGNATPIDPFSNFLLGGVGYAIAISAIAAIGGFLFGFDSGVINGTVDALSQAFGTASAGTGFAVASVLLGCAVGAFVAGALADLMGRRRTMLLTAAMFLVSA